jgi:lysozyme family protein
MTYGADFETAFARVIGHEKGYQNGFNDRGNWTSGQVGVGLLKGTKYGISAMSYPNLNIKALTVDDAKAIYYRDYWQTLRLDVLPQAVRFDMFDTAINSGRITAIKLLQRACGVAEDGVLGVVTIATANKMQPEQLDAAFNGYRLLFICDLSTWPDYGKGWVRRVAVNLIKD